MFPCQPGNDFFKLFYQFCFFVKCICQNQLFYYSFVSSKFWLLLLKRQIAEQPHTRFCRVGPGVLEKLFGNIVLPQLRWSFSRRLQNINHPK